jgi:hypothetical protein
MLKIISLLSIIPLLLFSQEQSSEFNQPASKVKWKSRARLRGLQNIDDFLNWTIPHHLRNFALSEPLSASVYQIDLSQGAHFAKWHGYFSLYDPLVGKVSKKKGGLQIALCLLTKISQDILDSQALSFATDEALTKVIAYRDMKVGDQIFLPNSEEGGGLVLYWVDYVFNLWRGMPAFGLVGESKAVPILLFRGTDFSLDSKRGWASLMSDVDPAGPGLTTFSKAREEIRDWLMKVSARGTKAKVMGFSLGGVLAAYTYLYERDWVSLEGSTAFNPPGFSNQVLQDWQSLSKDQKTGFRVYVNQGDLVSKIGKLFGDAYELSIDHSLKPLKAHTLFLITEKQFTQKKIDIEKENFTRSH